MRTKYIFQSAALSILLLLGCLNLHAQKNSELIDFIQKEVDRNLQGLHIEGLQRPFFISYAILEHQRYIVNAAEGSIIGSNYSSKTRNGFPFLLVGNYERTNTAFGLDRTNRVNGPIRPHPILNPDEKGIARAIWANLDPIYKGVANVYESKIAALKAQNISAEILAIPDFEQRQAIQVYNSVPDEKIDKAYWENFLKEASKALTSYSDLSNSYITFTASQTVVYYYDTEGTRYVNPFSSYVIQLHLDARATDEVTVSDDLYTEVSSFEQMPDLETYIQSAHRFVQDFLELRTAPKIKETYVGPVLITDMALCETFSELFFANDGFVAYRMFNVPNSPMEDMLEKRVIDRSLSMISLSGSKTYKGEKLNGYVGIDAQGVIPDEELVLVENGILKNVLSGRTPTKLTGKSNGHMRFQYTPGSNSVIMRVAPGNILVKSNQPMSNDELKQKLIETAKEDNLDYAYIIKRMRWGIPIMIYKVYVDDGREELVRGAALNNFTYRSYNKIIGASDQEFIHTVSHNYCPATYIVPYAMLFESLEVGENKRIQPGTSFLAPKPD